MTMRWLLVLLAFCTLHGASFPALVHAAGYPARVTRVLDGDTLEIEALAHGVSHRMILRLLGVDTPELKAAPCEALAGRRAADFVRAWVNAKGDAIEVTLAEGRDKYGRRLGRLSAGDSDLGEALLAAGHARVYHGRRRTPWC